MQAVLNRDVLREIMSCFTISLSDDAADEIKTKRRALLSLALTRSDISHIALDGIWRSMATLEPLVPILNGNPTTGPSTDPVLSYSTNKSGFWQLELSSSSIPDQCLTRVKSYLSRIHRLYFPDFPPAKEYTLWQALSSLGFPNPLCPSLQVLFLNPNTSTTAYHLIPLISPTLSKLILFDPTATRQGEIVSLALLDLMKDHNVKPLEILYQGFTTPRVILRIFGFSNLRTVEKITIDQVATFREIPEETLLIDLGFFASPRDVGFWLTRLSTLVTFTLYGSWRDLHLCLRDCGPIPTLRTFELEVSEAERGSSGRGPLAPLIPLISTISPSLHALHINAISDRVDSLKLADILALHEKPIELLGLTNCLTLDSSNDLFDIMKTWPKLRYLSIVPRSGVAEAHAVLPFLSRHASFLMSTILPLESSSLRDPLPASSDSCNCPLRHLRLSPVQNSSLKLQDTFGISLNLVSLFPDLYKVTTESTTAADEQSVGNLQAAIDTIHKFQKCSPSKLGGLFR